MMQGRASVNERLRALIAARQIYDAWMLLHGAYEHSIYRFILERTTTERIGEVSEAVWNAVYRALPVYRTDGSPRSWLLSIAQAKLSERVDAPRPASAARAMFLARAFGSLPMTRRELPALERAIAALPADERELLELRYVNGLRPRAIAVLVGRSVRAIEEDLEAIIDGLRVLGRVDLQAAPSRAARAHVDRGKAHFVSVARGRVNVRPRDCP